MIDDVGSESAPAKADLKRRPRKKAARKVDPTRLERTPPHSLEAEQGVLGCLLLAPREGVGRCLERFARGAEVFYDPRHQIIFETVVELCDANQPADLVTIGQRLRDKKALETVGGYPYLQSLLEAVPSAANLDYYADIVRQKYLLRRVLTTCAEISARVYDEQDDPEGLLDAAEGQFLSISQERAERTRAELPALVSRVFKQIEERIQNPGQMPGLPTGFRDYDRRTGGLQRGEMVVIAARPSMGKTSLAMNIVEHVAVTQGKPVGVFSLEMTGEQLVLRMICSLARVDQHKVRSGMLTEEELHRILAATSELNKAPVHIDDTAGLSIRQLRGRARRMWQQHHVELFVIDYLQLLNSSTGRRGDYNRQQEIAEISSGIKSLAKELDVPIIVLSQLNRDVEREKGRKPRLSDLRESGAIEQDADVVGLLYRADPDNPNRAAGQDDEEAQRVAEAIPVNLLIAKQRNGPTGDVHLTLFRAYTRFEDAALYSPDDIPAES
ncbi:MAG: replicative DNA helicase [Verrucomicrobia bacterium]|nr:MAG: replicative DNA helicase [Verrucomicrobiota bacterium]